MLDALFTSLLLVIAATALYLWQSSYCRRDLPPFPVRPIPILGNLLNLERNPRKLLAQWRLKCGDIFCLFLGPKPVVFLNGYDVIKEGLINHGDHLSGRAVIFLDTVSDTVHAGLVTNSGKTYPIIKAMSQSILKSMGMGKNMVAQQIQEEARCLIEVIDRQDLSEINLEELTSLAVANSTLTLIEGQRREYNDPFFRDLTNHLKESLILIEGTNAINYIPSLRFLPGDMFNAKALKKNQLEIFAALHEEYVVKKNYRKSDDDSIASFIDAFIKENDRSKRTGKDYVEEKNLLRTLVDLFIAGTDTSAGTISWTILYLLYQPELQDKIFKEIESEIGLNRFPTYQDSPKLPYLNAVIFESQRLASIVPMAAPHEATETITFRGYRIPKGSMIVPYLDSIFFDPKVWGDDVKDFRPERHIDSDGKLIVREELIPFSIGRRSCLGRTIGKMELFIYLAALLQKYRFYPVKNGALPPLKESFGMVSPPLHYKVRLVKRLDAHIED